MKRLIYFFCLAFMLSLSSNLIYASMQKRSSSKAMRIGYSIGINNITPESMAYAKSVGVDCIETSLSALINKNERTFTLSDEEVIEKVTQAKKAAKDAGIEIWSIHMPFGEHIDLSLANESERQEVVTFHEKVLEYTRILQPKIILFHPSFYLGLNEREVRKSQMIKSAIELNGTVRNMKATMVIENMTGYELLLGDGKRERPLCRTIEETVEIMGRLPNNIYAAIDMNHIKRPEKLIRAMGKRLKTVHIADGDGENERHYFPCSGEGDNDWTAILLALQETGYKGPFMFESAYKDVKDLKPCYDTLYSQFVEAKKIQPVQ